MKTTTTRVSIATYDGNKELLNAVEVKKVVGLDQLVAMVEFLHGKLDANEQNKLADLLRDARQLRWAKHVHKVGAQQVGLLFNDTVFISVSLVTKNHK